MVQPSRADAVVPQAAHVTSAGHTGGATSTASAPTTPSESVPASAEATVTPAAAVETPATVLEIGDSLGEDLGFGLHDMLRTDAGVTLVQGAQGDSGLVQPQFYDWPRHLSSMVEQYHPTVVVVFIGANDVQNLYVDGEVEKFGTSGWQAIYRVRVDAMMQEAVDAGARVLWVGMPIMRSASFSTAMQQLDDIYRTEAAAHPGVTYFSSWGVLATPSGEYAATLTGPDGRSVVVRTPDGVHITFGAGGGGADVLARAVVDELHARYGLPDSR